MHILLWDKSEFIYCHCNNVTSSKKFKKGKFLSLVVLFRWFGLEVVCLFGFFLFSWFGFSPDACLITDLMSRGKFPKNGCMIHAAHKKKRISFLSIHSFGQS